jgi:hypothetical protein
MQDRAQVILVITGLGAPTLEETFSSVPLPAGQKDPLPQARAGAPLPAAGREPVLSPVALLRKLR